MSLERKQMNTEDNVGHTKYELTAFSVFSGEGPPVPIPNTVVKITCADNTWLETAREDRAMLTRFKRSESSLRMWRNWQTRTFEGRVDFSVWVQVPSSAPEKATESKDTVAFSAKFAYAS